MSSEEKPVESKPMEEDGTNGKRSRPDDDSDDDAPLAKKVAVAAKPEVKTEPEVKKEEVKKEEVKKVEVKKEDAKKEETKKEEAKKVDEDSDDDVPLGQKKPAASVAVKTEKVADPPAKKKTPVDDDSEDDKPLANIKKEKAPAPAPAPKKKPAPESDSEDDKPLRPMKPKTPEKTKKKKKRGSDSDDEDDEDFKESRESKRKSGGAAKAKASPAKKGKGSGGKGSRGPAPDKNETTEDWLIQRFLVRWWYSLEWPPAEREVDVPPGYKEMEHYPYLYLNEATGHVLNKRDKANMPPCKQDLLGKPHGDLKALATSAIEGQIEALKKAEPDNVQLLKDLKREINEINGKKEEGRKSSRK